MVPVGVDSLPARSVHIHRRWFIWPHFAVAFSPCVLQPSYRFCRGVKLYKLSGLTAGPASPSWPLACCGLPVGWFCPPFLEKPWRDREYRGHVLMSLSR